MQTITAVTADHAWSGSRYINVLDPQPADIDVFEVATGLSREARYGGNATSVFWSVGQHSLLCERLAREDGYDDPRLLRTILLHDAPEYMLRDIIRPVKRNLPGYLSLEERWWRAIAARFDLPVQMPYEVKFYDDLSCAVEKKGLLARASGAWPGLPDARHRHIPLDLLNLSMERARDIFIERLNCLEEGSV